MSTHLDYEINKELGECYLFMGELDKAESYYQKAAASGEDQADPHMGLATIAMQRGELAIAMEHYHKAASLQESDKALAGLGLAHMNQGNHEEAFNLFSRSLVINPTNAVALNCLVREGYHLNRVEDLLPYLRSNLDLSDDSHTKVTLAGCLLSLKRNDEANALLHEVLEQDPDNNSARDLLEHIAA